jgi:general secretion pathway protein D
LGLAVSLAGAVLLGGCPKANTDFQTGKKAEAVQDYDTALVYYERALRVDPTNAEYKLRTTQMRFMDGQFHIQQGRAAEQKGDLQRALTEFEKAQAVDPSSQIADQEVRRALEKIAAQNAAEAPKVNPTPQDEGMLMEPPELKPLSREPINLKMTNDTRVVY